MKRSRNDSDDDAAKMPPPRAKRDKPAYRVANGSVLEADPPVAVIAHQVCCTAVSAHGFSSDVKTKYPYGDTYEPRKAVGRRNLAAEPPSPGGVDVLSDPAGEGPTIACLRGQFEMGKPGRYARYALSSEDTYANREKWFAQALEKLGEELAKRRRDAAVAADDEKTTVAFPCGVGCGRAGGDWMTYRRMIDAFARANPSLDVIVYVQEPRAPQLKIKV